MLGSPFHLFPLICLMEGARLLTKRHRTNLRSLIVLTAHFINTQVVNKLTNNANKSEQTQSNQKWQKSANANENCAWDPFDHNQREKWRAVMGPWTFCHFLSTVYYGWCDAYWLEGLLPSLPGSWDELAGWAGSTPPSMSTKSSARKRRGTRRRQKQMEEKARF